MRLLEKLARYYDLKRWEYDLQQREKVMTEKHDHELRYVEDLLVASQDAPVPPKQAEIERQVFYIVQKREDEARRLKEMLELAFKKDRR